MPDSMPLQCSCVLIGRPGIFRVLLEYLESSEHVWRLRGPRPLARARPRDARPGLAVSAHQCILFWYIVPNPWPDIAGCPLTSRMRRSLSSWVAAMSWRWVWVALIVADRRVRLRLPIFVQAAETGSGKTGAFALPAIQIAHEYRRTGRTAAVAASGGASPSEGGRPAKKARVESSQLSIEDRSPMLAITPDGLSCQCRQERDWAGARATKGVLQGKFYYEVGMSDAGFRLH